ncbi:MAG: PQQ-binding-like beta-propeller repeat protein, partial [Chloroflexia bacterium]|nr:PQQ-binding-like beta-propeller repeat protein [Chloroflexia bacterium]
MSCQTQSRWRGSIGIILAFLLALLATALVAWGGLLPRPARVPSPLLAPGEAALYRIHYDPEQSGLYAVHTAPGGPFPLDPTWNHPSIRLQEIYTGRPGEAGPVRTISFYTQEGGSLRVMGVLEAQGGNLYSPSLSLWQPDLPLGATDAGESHLQILLGPWSLGWELPYTLTHRTDEIITTPAGAFASTRFEWRGTAGALRLRHRFWYNEAAGPFPLVHEDESTTPPWRYELLSATWLEAGSGTAQPLDEFETSGPTALYRGDPGRSGQSPAPAAGGDLVADLPLCWSLAAAEDLSSPPLLLGDLLLFGDQSGRLWALDAASGAVRWTFHTGRPIVAAPAAAGGVVYVAAGTRLYALEAQEGLYLWSYTAEDMLQGSPLLLNGGLFFGAEDGAFYALDARTGRQRWRFAAGAPIVSAAAGGGGTVCFGTTSGALFALDAATGRPRWQVDLGQALRAHPVVADRTVYVGLGDSTGGGQVAALGLADGQVRWVAPLPGSVEAALAVDASQVYVTTATGLVAALDRRGGEKRWQVYLAEGQANAPLALDRGLVLADTAGTLRVLDKSSGRELARRGELWPIGASPAYGRGRLFVVDDYRHLQAFCLDGPPPTRTLRLDLQQDRLLADAERGGRPSLPPLAWAGQLLLPLDNGDLWLLSQDLGGERLAALGGTILTPPLIEDDVAYVALVESADGTGAVVAFDLLERSIRWQAELEGPIYAPLALEGGRVLACASTWRGGVLHALDAAGGAKLWQAPVACSGAPLADGSGVYLADGAVYALDAMSGQLRWQSADLSAGGGGLLCGDALYSAALGPQGAALLALEKGSGQVRWWSQERMAFPYGRPACDNARGQVLVAGLDGRVLALDAADGGLRWAHQAGEPFVSEPVVV